MTAVSAQPREAQAACSCPFADWEIITDDGASPEQRRDAWRRTKAALTAEDAQERT